ncbi:MAG: dethiobiotin synthase [Magnetococcus sp. DMHC-6]
MAGVKGVFITGTDTDVGKTVVSAWLLRYFWADYWKPIQAGCEPETDTETLQRLSRLPADHFHPSTYTLNAPLSPHEAARQEGITLALSDFSLPVTHRPLIIEGAGGLLVPLNDMAFMVDLMVQIAFPLVLVARSRLGTINHTLMSLEVMRSRGLQVAGVILTGPLNPANCAAIRTYGGVPIVAQIPWLDPLSGESLARIAPENGDILETLLA